MPETYAPQTIDRGALRKLGHTLYHETFLVYEKDRKALEEQWLTNLRQFKGMYDPTIDASIPDDQSKAYPKVTRNKVIGTVARLMEMLFPPRGTDKNYEVTHSPLPDLREGDLQAVLDKLTLEQGPDLTSDVIEAAILSYAKEKAKRLDKEVEDQLAELDYVALAKKIVFSGVLYGHGVLKGPMLLKKKARTWSKDPSGRYVATSVDKRVPFYDQTPVWDLYVDLSAKSLDATDAECQRHIFTRPQLAALKDRPDFMADEIDQYLRDHVQGNFKERSWEQALRTRSSDKSNVTNLSGRKYEVIEYSGRVNGQQLKACGVPVPEDKLTAEVEANVWMLDDKIIKAVLNPYNEQTRGYHFFVYEEDDINLLGNGLPVVMRDSQMAIAEAARMILDNGSVVCGPMLELNTQLLSPGQNTDVYARKTWLRDDLGMEAQIPAVREIPVNSYISELIQIIELFMSFADAETALPPPALGDVSGQGKESMRTTGNLSMLLGAAALPIRDTVRNFDRFTVSVITSLCHWNMEWNPNEALKGDFTVLAKGSTSLIAKEVRATALDQFWLTLDPEDKMYFNRRKVLGERTRVRDLPDDLFEEDTVVEAKLKEQADTAKAMASQQGELMRAQIRGEVASSFKDLMLGLKAQAGANVDTFNAIVEGIVGGQQATAGGGSGATRAAVPAQARAGVAGAS